ncbi:hypothetical protein OIU77_008592, partial [Salix suchowensis]
MAKPTLLAFLSLLLVFNGPSGSFSATTNDESVYESFLQCLEKNTNPQDKISNL